MPRDPADLLRRVLDQVDRDGPLERVPGVVGLSGDKILGLLQRLAREHAAAGSMYLEVGVFRGLTLTSVAAAVEEGVVCGIDNFSQFDPHGANRREVLDAIGDRQDVLLVDEDFEAALADLGRHLAAAGLEGAPPPIGCYFVDGPHDYRSQLLCLMLAVPYLAADAVIVVDDCNYSHVRRATQDFLTVFPEFALALEAYTPRHPELMDAEEHRRARAGWWNGVHVIARDPEGALERAPPSLAEDREIFYNEHLVHAARAAPLAPEILRLASAVSALSPGAVLRAAAALVRGLRRPGRRPFGPSVELNTYSDALPASRRNPALE